MVLWLSLTLWVALFATILGAVPLNDSNAIGLANDIVSTAAADGSKEPFKWSGLGDSWAVSTPVQNSFLQGACSNSDLEWCDLRSLRTDRLRRQQG